MGIYQKKVFKKNKKGEWECKSCKTETVSHDFNFWKKSFKTEQKSDFGEHTFLSLRNSKTSDKKFVSSATTYFGNDEKVVRTLLTTSNKLPKKKRK